MKRLFAGGTCLAAVLAFGMVALAQSAPPAQPPAQPPVTQPPAEPQPGGPVPAAQETKAPEEQVTIVGCVQKESDYRRAKNLGKGTLGTGVGMGDEFVLINASASPAGGDPAPTGTTGAPAGTDEFEVTGKNEEQLEAFVGKRVEITGKLKAAETKPTGTTGGATEALPGSRDLKLREVEIMSVKETAGTCPAMAR